MKYIINIFFVFTLLLTSVFAGEKINLVQVVGNKRIETETVQSYVDAKEFDVQTQDRIFKTLYATGLFSNVEVQMQQGNLIINVVENPVIGSINFDGNDHFEDKALKEEIDLEDGGFYSRTKLQSSVDRLLNLYKKSGRFSATIEPKLIERDNNRIDLIFEIYESDVTYIQKINFIGNKEFSDSRLRDVIMSREDAWWRILSNSTTYDSDRMLFDREKIREFYNKNGYIDAQVTFAISEIDSKNEGFILTFNILEGKQFNVSDVSINNKVKGLDNTIVEEQVEIEKDDTFNSKKVQDSNEDIVLEAGKNGFPFVKSKIKTEKNYEDKTVKITYEVDNAPAVYVERVNVRGNVRTLDEVVRREMALSEGDAFNKAKLERSKRDIRALGFFKTVEITEEAGSSSDKVVLNVDVEEQSTGDITFGIGYSTVDSVIGEVGLTERNFLGKGQYVRLSGALSGRRKQFDFGFTEPYFLDRRLSAGFDIFHVTTDYQDEASYDEVNSGFVLRSGFKIGEDLTLGPRYRLNVSEIKNVPTSFVSQILLDSFNRGKVLSSSLGYEIAYDKRDDVLVPTEGYLLRLNQDAAGLGGDVRALKSVATGTYYYTPFDEYTLSMELEGGAITPFGGYDLRIIDRFFLGGNSFRGFEVAGVGPRFVPNPGSNINDDTVGGNYFAVSRTELGFPLAALDELGMSGAIFSDVGTLWHLDNIPKDANGKVVDDTSIRASAGVGLKWRSPMGPIRLDFALPIVKEDYDKDEIFRFSAGSRF